MHRPGLGRRKPEPSQADWLEAASLLQDAAGVTTAPQGPYGLAASGAAPASNASSAAARGGDGALGAAGGGAGMEGRADEDGDPLEWGYAGVEVAPDGHAGALVELAHATERGALFTVCDA